MRSLKSLLCAGALPLLVLAAPGSASAVTIGMTDTFEDLTTMNWITAALGSPNPAPPKNVAGGPGGAGDHYLELTALGGDGPGSRLSVINDAQWAGDYLAAGITSIAFDVNNLGQQDVYLRLAFEDFPGPPPPNVAYSTDAILVPAGSGWTTVSFPIGVGDLTLVGTGTIADVLSSTDVLRIYHSQLPNFPNPVVPIAAINTIVGVDNITAVPEPAAMLLLAGGLAAAWKRFRLHSSRAA
jgi:hypothetical protein